MTKRIGPTDAGSLVGRLASVVLLSAPSASAGEESPERRTTDEIVQLYAMTPVHGTLSGYTPSALWFDESPVVATAGGVLVAATEATAIWWLDGEGAFGYGLPQAIVSDAWIGGEIAAAWIWRNVAVNDEEGAWTPDVQAAVLWSGTTLGAGIGVLRWSLAPSSPGRAALVGSSALWAGVLSGTMVGALDRADREQSASLATAIGLEAGVVLGATLLPRDDVPISRVRALDTGAALGGLAAAGIFVLASGDRLDSRGALASAAAGVVAGGFAGFRIGHALSPNAPRLAVTPLADGAVLSATF